MDKKTFLEYVDEFGFVEAIAELPYPTLSYEAFIEQIHDGEIEEDDFIYADYYIFFCNKYYPISDVEDVLAISGLFEEV